MRAGLPATETAPSGFALRPATDADATPVQELIFSILLDYGLTPDPQGTDADLAAPATFYRAAGGGFDVLHDTMTGRIVGTVGLKPMDARTMELRKMYLHRDCRGRGLGRLLLNHAIRRTREAGFPRLYLDTASVLHQAISLYQRSGFRACHEGHLSPRCDRRFELLLD
jgi:putative acetyltransferase